MWESKWFFVKCINKRLCIQYGIIKIFCFFYFNVPWWKLYASVVGSSSVNIIINIIESVERRGKNRQKYLIVDRLLAVGCSFHRSTMGISVLLARLRRRAGVSIRRIGGGFQQRAGTGIVVDGRLRVARVASRQRRTRLSRCRSDGLPAFDQFHYLVGFPRKIAVWSKRIIPAAVRTEKFISPISTHSPCWCVVVLQARASQRVDRRNFSKTKTFLDRKLIQNQGLVTKELLSNKFWFIISKFVFLVVKHL